MVTPPSQAAHVTVLARVPRIWSYKPVQVLIDGNVVGQIGWRRKAPFQVELPPGAHVLVARIGVIGSAPANVQLAPGQTRAFEVRWSRQTGPGADRDTNLVLADLDS